MSRVVRNLAAVVFLVVVFWSPTPVAAQDSCSQQQYHCAGENVAFQNCAHDCGYLAGRCVSYCGTDPFFFDCTDGPSGATGWCDCEPMCIE